ncbi:MAG: hypothetical protein P4L83_18975 [Nevskia sp.]|nr:hypothetical protein [Nevskia sp.]
MPALAIRVVRDVALVSASAALLRYADQGHTGVEGVPAIVSALAAALMVVLAAFLLHEWGHLAGAWASGAEVEVLPHPLALFLFRFDEGRNSRRQYQAMSCGGFAASGLTVAFLLATLSFHALADTIALALTAIGVAATLVLEVPPVWRSFRGSPT